jgi:hypothetical protein
VSVVVAIIRVFVNMPGAVVIDNIGDYKDLVIGIYHSVACRLECEGNIAAKDGSAHILDLHRLLHPSLPHV